MTSALISATELQGLLGSGNLRILDASYNLPPASMRIAGAAAFDIDDIADPKAPLAHTLPAPELFAEKVGALGVGDDSHVVIYDRAGMHMAASRAWWMFRAFGHEKVQVLDGGLSLWMGEGRPVTADQTDIKATTFTPRFRAGLVKSKDDILENLDKQDFTVLDARDASRYEGTAPEPRPGMQGGHIPGSLNTPFVTLIDPATGRMRNKAEIMAIFKERGVDTKRPLAISCGSGVTACVVALGLHEIGTSDAAIYDGSWTEWGGDADTPKKKGKEA